MLTGKTTVLLSDKAATDLHNVLIEASEWIQNVTGKKVDASNFRTELENGIILCELIERIKPGSIRRINRMNIAMAHLDNLKQFLNACEKFGLKDSQLFDVTDLQVQNTLRLKSGGIKHTTADRRLRNVCITLYWLGRRLANTPNYKGPQLNLEAFKEILDIPSNPSSIYLQGYDSPKTPPTYNKTHKPPSKQPTMTSTVEIDLEPMNPPTKKVDIKKIEKQPNVNQLPPPDVPSQLVNGMSPDDNISADDLLLSIENAVNELLLNNEPTEMKPQPTAVTPTELLQRNERSYSSPSPTSMSTPSPNAQPLPLFLDIKITCVAGVSLGLQLVGGADTAIPAQVEVVMPGKPAEASGLKAGDIIISIEGQDVTRLAHHQLIEFIKRSVGKGSLLLGVERSVEVPKPLQKTNSVILKEEHAERVRQQKEIAEMYGSKARSYSYSSGEEQQHKAKIIETHKEEEVGQTLEIAKSCDSSSNGESINEDFDIEIDDNLQWELPPSSVMSPPSPPPPDHSREQEEIQEISTATTTVAKDAMVEETMESTVTRLQEELEALSSLVSMNESPKSSPPPVGGGSMFDKSAGIGQIMSSTVKSVTIEPEQLMYSENIRYDNDNEEIFASTSDSNEEDLTVSDIGIDESRSDLNSSGVREDGVRNSYTNQQKERVPFQDNSIETTAPINEDDLNVKLYQKERWKTYRPEAEGREEKPTSTPSLDRTPVPIPNDPPPTHDDIDPFAPIAMKTSTSSHLLSDVLSLNKTDLKSNPKAFKSQIANSYSYKTTSSYTPNKATPTQSFSNNSRPYTQTNSKHSMSTPSQSQVTGGYDKDTRQPSFEAQDEIQEMHGVKVRAVQRKRWTPDTTRTQRSESLTKMPSVNTSYHSPMTQQSSVDQQSTLNKKSSIYERRDVVLMEVRNRGWSQGQNSSYKHDPKRPWSSQSRRNNHHICSHCRGPIYQGPMMAIPDKDLYFHHKCLVCVVCRSSVSMNYGRATVFLRHSLPHCTSCYSNDNGIKVTTC